MRKGLEMTADAPEFFNVFWDSEGTGGVFENAQIEPKKLFLPVSLKNQKRCGGCPFFKWINYRTCLLLRSQFLYTQTVNPRYPDSRPKKCPLVNVDGGLAAIVVLNNPSSCEGCPALVGDLFDNRPMCRDLNQVLERGALFRPAKCRLKPVKE